MAMLAALARAAPESVAVVATFDHGTGAAATRAAALVAEESFRLGFPCVIGAGIAGDRSEAELRASRFAFLNDVASRVDGVIATAHTRDDQVETVIMRVMRDAGARGLAGLYSPAGPIRPLLDVSRVETAAYARGAGVRWLDDPTNASSRYLRNRIRRDLLPALRRVSPGLDADVLALARRAAEWRRNLDRAIGVTVRSRVGDGRLVVDADSLAGFTPDELCVVWPALAARVGLYLDWRGIERAAAYTGRARVNTRIDLSGRWTLRRVKGAFELAKTIFPL